MTMINSGLISICWPIFISGVGRVRQSKELSGNGKGVGRGWWIHDASEGLETTMEVTGTRHGPQGIYDNNRGVGGGMWSLRLQQGQQMCWRRIDDISKGIEDDNGGGSRLTTGLVDWQQQLSFGFPCFQVATNNTVLSLSNRYLISIIFSSDSFFYIRCMKYYQYCNHAENILYQIYTNLAYEPPMYRRVKILHFLMINKDVRKSLACKKGNDNPIWSWNNSLRDYLNV